MFVVVLACYCSGGDGVHVEREKKSSKLDEYKEKDERVELQKKG